MTTLPQDFIKNLLLQTKASERLYVVTINIDQIQKKGPGQGGGRGVKGEQLQILVHERLQEFQLRGMKKKEDGARCPKSINFIYKFPFFR